MRLIILALCLAALAPGASAQVDTAVSGDLARLRGQLHLSAGQEAAWRRYAAAAVPNGQAEARRRATIELLPTLPTPRRIALIEAAMAQDIADFRRQAAIVEAFYEQLTPDQQRTFDRNTLPTAADAASRRLTR
jgi:hypothetical protein